jgi:hypothetical protein
VSLDLLDLELPARGLRGDWMADLNYCILGLFDDMGNRSPKDKSSTQGETSARKRPVNEESVKRK